MQIVAKRWRRSVEINVDDAVPAFVSVALERARPDSRPLGAERSFGEADAGIAPGIRKCNIEPAVLRRCSIDHRIQRGVVGHISYGATHVEPFLPESRCLGRERIGIKINQRDTRAVGGEDFSVCESEATGSSGDNHAEAGYVEL
jgi:hypothetical protein